MGYAVRIKELIEIDRVERVRVVKLLLDSKRSVRTKPPSCINLAPFDRDGRQPPQSEAVDGSKGPFVPDIEGIVEYIGALQLLEQNLRPNTHRHYG